MVDKKKMELDLTGKIEEMPEGVYVSDPNLKPWTDMTWAGIKKEQKEVVSRAARKEQGTRYYYIFNERYTPELVESIEKDCASCLSGIVDGFRAKLPKGAQPIECDWFDVYWSDFEKVIQEKLYKNELVLKQFEGPHEVTAVNFSIAVANAYRAVINDRNEIIIFPQESNECQSDR